MRQFRDAAGVEWQVYETDRSASAERGRDHLLPAEYRHGWLVFESENEKRRLAPVPPGWSEVSDEALAALCASATNVQARGAKRREQPVTVGAADVTPPRRGKRGALRGPEGAQLQAVEERLAETLNEVCDAPSVAQLDTGELIRVEETLAIAAETAKEVVSLRQKRRTQGFEREERNEEPRD